MKTKDNLTLEERTIENAKTVLSTSSPSVSLYQSEFKTLLKQYIKLNNKTRKLLKMSDMQQQKVLQLNEELSQTNELLAGNASIETLQVHVDLLTRITQLSSELIQTRNQLNRVLKEDISANTSIYDVCQHLDMISSSLHESIMETRMQPLSQIFAPFPKLVRTLAQNNNKRIKLDIQGADIELDKIILDELYDLLFQIIHYTCEYSMEEPEERVKNKKDMIGTISIQVLREAGHITVAIQDDGKGWDRQSMERLLSASYHHIREEDCQQMLIDQIFSQLMEHDGVTQPGNQFDQWFLGIKQSLKQMSGEMSLHQEDKSSETHLYIKVPISLSIMPSLIIEIFHDGIYLIPQANVLELVSLFDSEIYTSIEYSGDREIFRLREDLLPIVRLDEVLKQASIFNEETLAKIAIKNRTKAMKKLTEQKTIKEIMEFIVVKSGKYRFGLIVDSVVGMEDIVAMPLHQRIKHLKIYSGTTILGDGSVALILDIEGICKHAGIKFYADSMNRKKQMICSDDLNIQRVMIFASGPHERFGIPLGLIKRLEVITLSKIQKIGDREFITIDSIPVRVLQFDQFIQVSPCMREQTMHLLIPRDTPSPIGFLIRHLYGVEEIHLGHDIKNYEEDGLAGVAMIHNQAVLFPDVYQLIRLIFSHLPKKQKPAEQKTVLLVEDTIFFRKVFQSILESNEMIVFTANDGIEALSVLENRNIDLIVSDLEMPRMDGFELFSQIKSNPKIKNIPIIALTALDTPKTQEKCLSMGFNAFISKRNKDTLIQIVNQILWPDSVDDSDPDT